MREIDNADLNSLYVAALIILQRHDGLYAEIHGASGLALRHGALPATTLKPQPEKAVLAMFERFQALYKSRSEPQQLSFDCFSCIGYPLWIVSCFAKS